MYKFINYFQPINLMALKSKWFLFAISAGTLGVAVVIALSLQPKEFSPNSEVMLKENSLYHAGGYDCEPSQVTSLSGSKRLRRQANCAEAEHQYVQEANSLIAAQHQADAADASATYSYVQSKIAAWGAALGFITMCAAIAAAYYAKRAAEEARRSADISAEELTNTRESAKDDAERFASQLKATKKSAAESLAEAKRATEIARETLANDRAWLLVGHHVERNRITGGKWKGIPFDGEQIAFSVINFGKTPALNVGLKADQLILDERDAPPPTTLEYSEIAPGHYGVVAQGNRACSATIWLSNKQISGLQDKSKTAYMYFSVVYNDIFNPSKLRTSTYCLRVFPNGFFMENQLVNDKVVSVRGIKWEFEVVPGLTTVD